MGNKQVRTLDCAQRRLGHGPLARIKNMHGPGEIAVTIKKHQTSLPVWSFFFEPIIILLKGPVRYVPRWHYCMHIMDLTECACFLQVCTIITYALFVTRSIHLDLRTVRLSSGLLGRYRLDLKHCSRNLTGLGMHCGLYTHSRQSATEYTAGKPEKRLRPNDSLPARVGAHPRQRTEQVVGEHIDAAVIGLEVVDLLLEDERPEILADKFYRVKGVVEARAVAGESLDQTQPNAIPQSFQSVEYRIPLLVLVKPPRRRRPARRTARAATAGIGTQRWTYYKPRRHSSSSSTPGACRRTPTRLLRVRLL